MNKTRAKERLSSQVSKEISLELDSSEEPVQDRQHVFVYGLRKNRGSSVSWSVKRVFDEDNQPRLGEDIELIPYRQQLLISCVIEKEDDASRPFRATSVEVVEQEGIDKCKSDIKEKFIQLYRLGYPEALISNGTFISADEHLDIGQELRRMSADDIKVTTVRSKGKAMHLGRADRDKDYLFKLGVNWSSWHLSGATYQLKSLTHELVHCMHPHHERVFFQKHAEVVATLDSSPSRRSRVEELFDGEINWNKLKTLVMSGVNDQLEQEPRFNTYSDACESVVDDLEQVLEYNYEAGQLLHTHQPGYQLLRHAPSQDKENGVEYVPLNKLEVSETYTDDEFFSFLKQSLKQKREDIGYDYVISKEQVPVVDDDLTVVDNKKTAALFKQMVNTSNVITEDGFEPDQKVPVRKK